MCATPKTFSPSLTCGPRDTWACSCCCFPFLGGMIRVYLKTIITLIYNNKQIQIIYKILYLYYLYIIFTNCNFLITKIHIKICIKICFMLKTMALMENVSICPAVWKQVKSNNKILHTINYTIILFTFMQKKYLNKLSNVCLYIHSNNCYYKIQLLVMTILTSRNISFIRRKKFQKSPLKR